MVRSKLCMTCVFFDPDKDRNSPYGFCRKYAPKPNYDSLIRNDVSLKNDRFVSFPLLHHEEWCGEWKGK